MNSVTLKGFVETVGQAVERIGVASDETEELRLQQTLAVAAGVMMGSAGVVWGIFLLVFNETLPSLLPFGYTVATVLNAALFRVTHRYRLFRFNLLTLSLFLPFLTMISLGGYQESGAMVIWSLVAPMGAMLFTGRREAIGWFVGFIAVVTLGAALEPILRDGNNLPVWTIFVLYVMNIGTPFALAIILLRYFLTQKDAAMEMLHQEQEKSERLLLNVLPKEIVPILKEDDTTVADYFDSVSVLFADIVGFTSLSVRLPPRDMVDLLDEVFSFFDTLADKYGLEKIRTIGDNYLIASGVPVPRTDHAHALAGMALEMMSHVGEHRGGDEVKLQFRLGMNSGPAVAGVIGRQKFHYDLWGDAVNIASRMESHGVPGKIQIARPTYDLIKDDFVCVPRGLIEVKGKGQMETWFLEGRLR